MRLSYIHTKKDKRILRLNGLKIGKRASLELSINAIVVLILAITMLGLGLGFMRSTFGSATSEFKKVSKEVEKQLIDRLKQSEDPVSLSVFSIEIEKNTKETILMGIKNSLGCQGPATFQIIPDRENCRAIGVGADNMCDEGKVDVTTFDEQIVNPNDVGIVPINIKTGSTVVPSTVRIPLLVNGPLEEDWCEGVLSENDKGRVELLINVI